MKRPLLLLFLLLAPAMMRAQMQLYSLDFDVSQKDFADTIAIDYEKQRVVVPVTVGGKSMRFLLDTGASQTTIYDDVELEGAEMGGFIVSHDAVATSRKVPTMKLPPMTIGRTTFTGMQAIVQHRAVKGSSIDGIVGFDLVCKGLHMKIDVRQRQLILSDRYNSFDSEGGVRLKYRLNFHVPYINIEPFSGYSERVLFDTGSRHLYMMNRKSFDQGEAKTRGACLSQVEGRSMGRHAIGHGGTEQRGETLFLALERLQIGTFALNDVHTLSTQGGSHVGAALLQYGTVAFNPERKRMYFVPYDQATAVTVGNRQTEKTIVPIDGRPVVGLVWERGEAYSAGLREGDTIVMVDGRSIGSMADYLRFGPRHGQEYTIVVTDAEGHRKEIRMTW